MSWLSNAWVVGIGTGLLSGLLVTWIARLFLSKRDDREYQQKVLGANHEIVYALRPGISEGEIPDREIVVALAHATARKYDVAEADLYSPTAIAEELIKEVMDSSFLSAAKKREYCTQLAPLREQQRIGAPQHSGVVQKIFIEPKISELATPGSIVWEQQMKQYSDAFATYRRRQSERISTIMGLFAAITTTAMLAFSLIPKLKLDGFPFPSSFVSVAVAVGSAIAALLTLSTATLFRTRIKTELAASVSELVNRKRTKDRGGILESKEAEQQRR